jgi:hypothetical protein
LILIDAATGSNELAEPLRRMGLAVEVTHLDFGDIVFSGRGEGGAPLYIGIELKKIGEFVESIRSKRFQGHQLLGLTKDFDRRYLVLEGDYHHDTQGRVVAFRGKGKPRPMPGAGNAVALEQEILNIQTRGGCWVRHTTTRRDTLRFIEACYRYWTEKDLDEHKSHMAVYAPDLDRGLLIPTSDFRRVLVVLLPGIGLATSRAVEERCTVNGKPSMRKMLALGEADWAAIETVTKGKDGKEKRRKLGESRARQIMGTLETLR